MSLKLFAALFLTVSAAFAQFTPIRVNCGGTAYTDSTGNLWAADFGFSGSGSSSTSQAIAGTNTPFIYQSGHYGKPLTYTFPVPPGSYLVTLKFAEFVDLGPGKRVFSVAINGATVLPNFDIYATAGPYTAIDQSFSVDVTGSAISIVFSPSVDNGKVNAIEITQIAPQPPPPPPPDQPLFSAGACNGTTNTTAGTVTVTCGPNVTVVTLAQITAQGAWSGANGTFVMLSNSGSGIAWTVADANSVLAAGTI